MLKLARSILMFVGCAGILFVLLCLRPVPIMAEKECASTTGTVSSVIGNTKNQDITIYLNGVEQRYYINRGMENGINPDSLRAKMMNRQVTVFYPKYWTPLDPKQKMKHLSKIVMNDEVIFSEIEDL